MHYSLSIISFFWSVFRFLSSWTWLTCIFIFYHDDDDDDDNDFFFFIYLFSLWFSFTDLIAILIIVVENNILFPRNENEERMNEILNSYTAYCCRCWMVDFPKTQRRCTPESAIIKIESEKQKGFTCRFAECKIGSLWRIQFYIWGKFL